MAKHTKSPDAVEAARIFIENSVEEADIKLTVPLAREVITLLCKWLRVVEKDKIFLENALRAQGTCLHNARLEIFSLQQQTPRKLQRTKDRIQELEHERNGLAVDLEVLSKRNRELLMCKKEDVQALEERFQRAADMADELAMKNQHLRDKVEQLKALLESMTALYAGECTVSSVREGQSRELMRIANLGGGFDLSEEEET